MPSLRDSNSFEVDFLKVPRELRYSFFFEWGLLEKLTMHLSSKMFQLFMINFVEVILFSL